MEVDDCFLNDDGVITVRVRKNVRLRQPFKLPLSDIGNVHLGSCKVTVSMVTVRPNWLTWSGDISVEGDFELDSTASDSAVAIR